MLVPASLTHIENLMSWLPDRDAVASWGGPLFRYPFTRESFLEDVRWDEISTFVLLDAARVMVGFGQVYEKNGRGHLARLIVSKGHRGNGYGRALIEQICEKAREQMPWSEFSLFVARDNDAAIRCYSTSGFEVAPYPVGDTRYPSMIFMIKK